MNRGFLFSIIIPTYNRASYLPASVQSVLDQTFSNWECLIIDDGSTDNTKDVVSIFKDDRIKYFFKQNEERSVARNYGIERATGKYICFLDSDDIYYPHHLEYLKAKIKAEHFPVAIFNTGMNEFRDGKKLQRPAYSFEEYGHPVFFIWKKFMLPSSVCLHSDILKKYQFPIKFNVWEDTHLWLRVVVKYPFYQIDNITTQWNNHEKGSVALAFKKVESAHVKNYLKCISHLFDNYGNIVYTFLDKNEVRRYKLGKLKMFMILAFNKKQYFTFLDLYFYGIRKVGRVEVNSFAYPLISILLKSKLRSIMNV